MIAINVGIRPLIKTDDNCGAPVLVKMMWKDSLVSSALCPRYDRVEWNICDDTEEFYPFIRKTIENAVANAVKAGSLVLTLSPYTHLCAFVFA